jgi:UDP-N-acetylglucosamine acyltransferase
MSCTIHPTAIVDSKAEIGVEVQIGAYSIIGPNVKIGDRSWIGPHVIIEGRTTLGSECEIFQFASIGSKPQDLKFHDEPSTLIIGAKNKIREFVTLQPGTEHGHMTTVIGDNNLFMANSHVGHDCRIGSNNVFANSAGLAGHVSIASNVILGGLIGIHQFVRIGDYVMLSGGSMVGHDIPPYCIAQGDRCFLRGVNTIGLQRAGFSEEEIMAVKKVYRLLFSTVGGVTEKISKLPAELSERPHIKHMLEFIEGSERGISSPFKS